MTEIKPEDIEIEYSQALFGEWWYKATLSLPNSRKVNSVGRTSKRTIDERPDIIMQGVVSSLTDFLSKENDR